MKTELESLGLWPGCEQPQDFVETKFYQQELENTKKRVEERGPGEREIITKDDDNYGPRRNGVKNSWGLKLH